MRILFPSKLMLAAVAFPTRKFHPVVIRSLANASLSFLP
jgi:hypothetical protein